MEALTLVSGLAALAASGVGVGIGARLLPVGIRARRDLKHLNLSAATEAFRSSIDLEERRRRLARPAGKRRDSAIAGLYEDALRHADGSYSRAYHAELLPTMLASDHVVEARYDELAQMLAVEKPPGTVIQFRLSAGPDPGKAIADHLNAKSKDRPTHPEASLLHEMNLDFYRAAAGSGVYRQNLLSVWARVPVKHSADATSRGVFLLKNQLEALVVTRIRAIKAIDSRIRNGILDPQADLQDFEEYLRDSIGRSSQDTVANMERLARMDNQLERLYYDLQMARARRAGAEAEKTAAQKNLDKELAKPEAQRCASCIDDLKREIASCELLISGLDATITDLWTQIEQRAKKYNVVLQDQANFGQQVKTLDQSWTTFNGSKDALSELLDEIEGRRIQSQH
jgi:predicted  nucleic acid-binding Zn-ribbon protein